MQLKRLALRLPTLSPILLAFLAAAWSPKSWGGDKARYQHRDWRILSTVIDPQIRGALRRALNRAAEESSDGRGFLNLSEDGTVWAGTGMGFIPWFEAGSDGRINTPQGRVFGLQLFRAALRSALLNARALTAGDLLQDHGMFAAASALYYTGAFHGLDGLLASRGRVLIHSVRGPMHAHEEHFPNGGHRAWLEFDELPGHPEVLCGVLSLKPQEHWMFEPRGRTHQQRWAELKQLVSARCSTLPGYVLDALRYAVGPGGESLAIAELLHEGIPALARLRHQALYEGFGYDDLAFDGVMNGDNPGYGLALRCEVLKTLAEGLLANSMSVADVLFEWESGETPNASRVSRRLALSVMIPSFETRDTDLAGHPLGGRVAKIHRWLAPRASGKSSR